MGMQMKHFFQNLLLAIVCLIPTLALLGLAYGVPAINSWEKANNFPYGRMCDPNIFNGYTSSCRH